MEEDRRFEIYTIEIDPGGRLSAEPHPPGTQEFLSVFQGELTLSLEEQEIILAAGDSIRFRADRAHVYANTRATLAQISLTILYA